MIRSTFIAMTENTTWYLYIGIDIMMGVGESSSLELARNRELSTCGMSRRGEWLTLYRFLQLLDRHMDRTNGFGVRRLFLLGFHSRWHHWLFVRVLYLEIVGRLRLFQLLGYSSFGLNKISLCLFSCLCMVQLFGMVQIIIECRD